MTTTNSGIILIVDTAIEQSSLFQRQATPNRISGQYERSGTAQLEQLKAADCPLLILFAHPALRSNWVLESLQCNWGVCPDSQPDTRQLMAYGTHMTQHWRGWVFCFVSEGIQASTAIRLQKMLNRKVQPDSPVIALTNTDSERHPIAFPQHWGYRLLQQQAMSWLEHSHFENTTSDSDKHSGYRAPNAREYRRYH